MSEASLSLLAAALAGWLWAGPSACTERVLRVAVHQPAGGRSSSSPVPLPRPGDPAPRAGVRVAVASPAGRLGAAALAGLGVAVIVGWPYGAIAGLLAAALTLRWLSRLEPAAVRARRRRTAEDLPLTVDLLAACLAAGGTVDDAALAAADAVEGPVADQLRTAVASMQLGAEPAQAWQSLAEDPVLAPLGRVLGRAAASGAPVAAAMRALAEEQRLSGRWTAEAAARKVGVRAVLPLGVCFLPAFVLVGVVPVVVGVAAQLGSTWS